MTKLNPENDIRCIVHDLPSFAEMMGADPKFIAAEKLKREKEEDKFKVERKSPYPKNFDKERRDLVCRIYNYRCVICGVGHSIHGNGGLLVHHIDYNKQNSKLTNLVPLCEVCHNRIPYRDESVMWYILKLPVVKRIHAMLNE